ncbi:MAG: hypothetical protein SX243_15710 [Acidobacteriota bacterium]|nr:hypothetical protein [Acidobacteriota bacterium]
MNLSRRKFLEFLGVSASALAVGHFPAVETRADIYFNRSLGFRFRKPHDWFFVSRLELGQMLVDQQLACPDEGQAQMLKDSVGLPMVSVAKSQPSRSDEPIFNLFVEELDGTEPSDVEAHGWAYAEVYRPYLKELSFYEIPRLIDFGNVSACECGLRYLFEGAAGEVFPLRVRSILFPRGRFGYTLNMMDREGVGWSEAVRKKFSSILTSFEFVELEDTRTA